MSIFNKLFKKQKEEKPAKQKVADLKLDEEKETAKPAASDRGPIRKTEEKKEGKEAIKKESKPALTRIDKKDRKEHPFAHQILIKPLVTEKASTMGAYNQYVFEVSTKTNKVEIKKAVQSVYGVEPEKVRVINMGGRQVRYGKRRGRTRSWKKAFITLKPGDKIEVYEGV